MNRQCVRPHRWAFSKHAIPIHASAMIQMTVRAETSTSSPTTMAPLGNPQANPHVRTLPIQSVERCVVVFITALVSAPVLAAHRSCNLARSVYQNANDKHGCGAKDSEPDSLCHPTATSSA